MKSVQIHDNAVLSPIEQWQAVSAPTTLTDLIFCTSSKLRPFAAKFGDSAVQAILSGVLTEISNAMSFETTQDMIRVAAEIIIDEYPDTKLSDFKMFRKLVIGGKIGGKLFRWDARTICEAWGEYYAQREEAFCDYREAKHNEDKQAYLKAYEGQPKEKDMDKIYAKLKQDAANQELKKKWRTKDLQEICKDAGKDYSVLLATCESDCREVWTPDAVISFDDYVKLHLVRVLNEIRSNPERLEMYC